LGNPLTTRLPADCGERKPLRPQSYQQDSGITLPTGAPITITLLFRLIAINKCAMMMTHTYAAGYPLRLESRYKHQEIFRPAASDVPMATVHGPGALNANPDLNANPGPGET
jgi:hypothetical protein